MAKDILVTESLSDSMVKAGAKLIERLDAISSEVESAFWLYVTEERAWKLILASELAVVEGPRNYYKRVITANAQALDEEDAISLNNISVTNTSNQIVQSIGFMIRADDISDVRFSRNTINGVFIEDAYVYRSEILIAPDQ